MGGIDVRCCGISVYLCFGRIIDGWCVGQVGLCGA